MIDSIPLYKGTTIVFPFTREQRYYFTLQGNNDTILLYKGNHDIIPFYRPTQRYYSLLSPYTTILFPFIVLDTEQDTVEIDTTHSSNLIKAFPMLSSNFYRSFVTSTRFVLFDENAQERNGYRMINSSFGINDTNYNRLINFLNKFF